MSSNLIRDASPCSPEFTKNIILYYAVYVEFKFMSLMKKKMSRILALNERCRYALHM